MMSVEERIEKALVLWLKETAGIVTRSAWFDETVESDEPTGCDTCDHCSTSMHFYIGYKVDLSDGQWGIGYARQFGDPLFFFGELLPYLDRVGA